MDVYRVKCIIVGDSNVGKSLLVKRVITDTCDKVSPTIGVDFSLKSFTFDDKVYNINFWDISGKEKPSVSCSTLFKNSNVAWICFDLTDPNSLIQTVTWKREIENIITIPCILVGCKLDRSIIDETELSTFVTKHKFDSFVITSAKKDVNIDELMEITCSVMKSKFEPVEKFESIPLILPPLDEHIPEKPNSCCFS